MSAARIVAANVNAALPDDTLAYEGQFTHDNPDERAVAVYPVGGQRSIPVIGTNIPRVIHDRVRVQLRALADDAGWAWLHAMADRLRYMTLSNETRIQTPPARLYFSPGVVAGEGSFADVRQTWYVIRMLLQAAPRFTPGRKYTLCDVDFRVVMRPLAVRPSQVALAWDGSPFTVYEQRPPGDPPPPAVEVQRTTVAAGRVLVGGRIRFGAPGPATNPPDDPFGVAGQGPFPGAAAGEVLWRNTSVAPRTTGSGGTREVNLFSATTTNTIPGAAAGGTVRLLKVVLNDDDSVSIVVNQRFDADLELNGLFFAREAPNGPVYTLALAGPPVNRFGDLHYDVTPPPDAGFKSATAAGVNLWDWAFVDGQTWETEPWTSQPPAGAKWRLTWRLQDEQGNDHPRTDLLDLAYDGPGTRIVQPVQVLEGHTGTLVQSISLVDASTPLVGRRGRYTVPVVADGLVVHGEGAEPPAAVPPAAEASEFGPEYDEAFS